MSAAKDAVIATPRPRAGIHQISAYVPGDVRSSAARVF